MDRRKSIYLQWSLIVLVLLTFGGFIKFNWTINNQELLELRREINSLKEEIKGFQAAPENTVRVEASNRAESLQEALERMQEKLFTLEIENKEIKLITPSYLQLYQKHRFYPWSIDEAYIKLPDGTEKRDFPTNVPFNILESIEDVLRRKEWQQFGKQSNLIKIIFTHKKEDFYANEAIFINPDDKWIYFRGMKYEISDTELRTIMNDINRAK